MSRVNFYKANPTTFIVLFSLAVAVVLGLALGYSDISKKLILAGVLMIPFGFITITRPWVAVMIFFLLIPLEELFVFKGNVTATLNKLIGAYLVFLVITSGSLKYIGETFRNKKALFIILFGLVSIASIYVSKDPAYSIRYLVKLGLLIISYFVLTLLIRDIKTLNYAVIALITGTVISVLSPLFLGHGDVVTANGLERYGGLWGDQNEFAGMLLILIPLCIAIVFTTGSKWLKTVLTISAVILIAGFLLTYSRSGFIALCVLCVIAMFKFIHGKNRARTLAILVPCLILGFIVVYYTIGDNIISRVETLRILESKESVRQESSLSVRYYYYFELFPKIFAEHPLLGVGFRGFVLNNPIYKQISHNTFIEVLTGTGLLGFIPFIFILYLTWRDIRQARTGLSLHNVNSMYLARYSNALEMGFFAFITVGLFYSTDINKMLWLTITLSSVLLNIRNLENNKVTVNTYRG